jgi:hypothetical protein
MDAQFRLFNNIPKNYISFIDYTDEDKKACEEIKKIRNYEIEEFNKITNINNYQFKPTQRGSYIKKLDNNKYEICLKKKNGAAQNITVSSAHIKNLLFNSGWFEYQVASLLSQWKYAKEIRLNCVFKTVQNLDKNEIDIIINTGIKLLFVECKTQIFDNTNIDKFHNSVRVYGGLASKALLVTDAIMRNTAIEKCKDNDVLHFSLQDQSRTLSIEKALFMQLESALFEINPK